MAVRCGKWKLSRRKQAELYDLSVDVSEEYNLADKHPAVVGLLIGMMERFDRDLKANARPPGRASAKG
jgi:hypothetical protein